MFSADLRSELYSTPFLGMETTRAEIAAITQQTAHMSADSLVYLAHSHELVEYIGKVIKYLYSADYVIAVEDNRRLGRDYSYSLSISDKDTVIDIIRCQNAFDPVLAGQEECYAFMRGLFLCCGTISDPNKSYHLEFALRREQEAEVLHSLLCSFSLNARMTQRRGTHVVYVRECEHIEDMLIMMGAPSAMMTLENARLMKSIINDVNRRANCDDANTNKTMTAATRQRDEILLIEAAGMFPKLKRELREVAELRLEYPSATLEEIAELLPGVSKSGVNHRFRRIHEIAQQLQM